MNCIRYLDSILRCPVLFCGVFFLATHTAFSDDPKAGFDAAVERSQTTESQLDEVIAAVRKSEDLFRNLDVTYRTSRKYLPQPPNPQAGPAINRIVLEDKTQTHRQATQGDRLYFSCIETTKFVSGQAFTCQSVAVCDGSHTLVTEERNSATLFHVRYEPARMLPPHAWGLYTLNVNVPLSVLLQGTVAVKAHPKVRRSSAERGSDFDIDQLEVESLGEEVIDDLRCVKIKVKCWDYRKSPGLLYLWLAKDRNFHVAQCRKAMIQKDQESISDTLQVKKWRELKPGLWLPSQIDADSQTPNGDAKLPAVPAWTSRLSLARADLNPELGDAFFRLPEVPEALPTFVIGADDTLIDAALFPRPVPSIPGTTLNSILDRLVAEEAKFDRIRFETEEQYY